MTSKQKPPARPKVAAKGGSKPTSVANPLRQADSRWQRKARYNWDKGGARGGRK